jgi:hypothetical protein
MIGGPLAVGILDPNQTVVQACKAAGATGKVVPLIGYSVWTSSGENRKLSSRDTFCITIPNTFLSGVIYCPSFDGNAVPSVAARTVPVWVIRILALLLLGSAVYLCLFWL